MSNLPLLVDEMLLLLLLIKLLNGISLIHFTLEAKLSTPYGIAERKILGYPIAESLSLKITSKGNLIKDWG